MSPALTESPFLDKLINVPRIPDSIRRPAQILGKPGTLHSLYTRARELLALQTRVRTLVPGDVYVAACEDGILHLITPSAALATRLRYSQRQLVAALRARNTPQEKFSIEAIRVSVRPDPVAASPRPREALPLSPQSAKHLESTAKYIGDGSLRKALIRLSTRTRET